jgi:hypothetical protein
MTPSPPRRLAPALVALLALGGLAGQGPGPASAATQATKSAKSAAPAPPPSSPSPIDAAHENAMRHYVQGLWLETSGDVPGAIGEVGRAFAYEPAPTLRVESDPLYEAPPRDLEGVLAAVRSLEAQVGALPHGVVLRYGYFYGPGTAYAADGSLHADAKRRRVPIAGAGSGVFSFVHVEDAAAATLAALESSAAGTFNIVDDDPAAVRDWVPVYAAAIGAPKPWRVPGFIARLLGGPYGAYLALHQPGASNAKAKRELGWTPRRASWRMGFAEAARPH